MTKFTNAVGNVLIGALVVFLGALISYGTGRGILPISMLGISNEEMSGPFAIFTLTMYGLVCWLVVGFGVAGLYALGEGIRKELTRRGICQH
jgi:hypothetical protein